MKSANILRSYLVFSFLYLLLPFIGFEMASWYLKPFLLPFLLLSVGSFEDFKTKRTLLLALLFSWIGDIILMFADKAEIYFILGLISFLLSHLIYITLFLKQDGNQNQVNKKIVILGILLIAGYFLSMILLLFPKLGALQIPVMVYAFVITTMLYFAFKGSLQWEKPAAYFIIFGAILFVLSDSILAFNKFYEAIPQSSFWIMSTYILAQFFIVSGILELNKKK